MNTPTEIGRRLKAARRAMGWTLRDVCERIPYMSTSKLGNYEAGRRTPDIDTIKDLAVIYKTSSAYLATLTDTPEDPREQNLAECFRAADERGKTAIMRTAELESTFVVSAKAGPANIAPGSKNGTDG